VPQLLERLRGGDQSVLNQLTAALYDELRAIAMRHIRRERSDHTLQTTALVHEAYLKLCGSPRQEYTDRVHFLSVASRVMRQVLVDYARARATQKRSGGESETENVDIVSKSQATKVDLLDLDRALDALHREDRSLARLIEMKYFGGMSAEETAEALGQSIHAVRSDLHFAEAWLRQRLTS
jgi:RNA polymerase sigma factor (TIGR02999 family)